MPEYPIQVAKVQPPPLREATLARDRLLEWLSVKIHGRVVLVIAEAGYGKTTLLADFSRRTRIRPLWFRLDRGDRDWVGFLAYLVAAVRIHVPGFAPVTDSLIRETSAAPPSRESVLDTFLRELGELPPEPAALILDDFHLVDDSPDVRHVMKELLARAPERLSFVFVSRRTPPVALARLRALGEVATLGTDDLRFDQSETERLFRETYEMRLEPSLVVELSRRTEGWAASLQLVRAALRGRSASEVRKFIHSLSGAEGDLYDYLAEEVVAELPPDLQDFLMRTSLLDTVDTDLGPVAASVSLDDARRLIDEGEQLGLFGRRGASTPYQVRAHPLVRDFLQARLARSIGSEGIRDIHLAVARAAEPLDWQIATHHYRAADSPDDARRVLSDSIETILGTGAYAAAEELALNLAGESDVLEIVRARTALQRGAYGLARDLALETVRREGATEIALWNALMILASCGDLDAFESLAPRLRSAGASSLRRKTADAMAAGILASVGGDLRVAKEAIHAVIEATEETHFSHMHGVSLTNLAQLERVRGDAQAALQSAREAAIALESSSAGIELVSAKMAEAWALAHLGDLHTAREVMAHAHSMAARPAEPAFESADIEVLYGDDERAEAWLRSAEADLRSDDDLWEQALLTWIGIDLRRRDTTAARARLEAVTFGRLTTGPGIEARRLAAAAHVAVASHDGDASALLNRARVFAARQGAGLWVRYVDALAIALEGDAAPEVTPEASTALSMVAEHILEAAPRLSDRTADQLAQEVARRPERWRPALRRALEHDDERVRRHAAVLLDRAGEQSDVAMLRRVSRTLRPSLPSLGRSLARRLASQVFVDDLGHVEVRIGTRLVQGVEIRRRVLALLVFLLTKTRFSASREEVVDALWPDLEPDSALNSLNQTVYFLRRVFEPAYSEDTSPGYVGQTTDKVWLDEELVASRSQRCRTLLKLMDRVPEPHDVLQLAQEYRGRFALDFLYEDWAGPYRDSLHAAFLRAVEGSLRLDLESGHYSRGIVLAQLAVDADPQADELQGCLVRLYRLSDAHAAAAEQYAHYAHTLREIGVDPPPLEDV